MAPAPFWLIPAPEPKVTSNPLRNFVPEVWVFVARPGRILYEIAGLPKNEAVIALRKAGYKLPIKTKVVSRETLNA